MSNTKSSECEVGVADIDPILQTARVAVEWRPQLNLIFRRKMWNEKKKRRKITKAVYL